MNFQYPVELLAKSAHTRFQAGFAKLSTLLLPELDAVLLEPSSKGLRILAASENALEQPTRLLREIYGDEVVFGKPRPRLMYGHEVKEPVMSATVRVDRRFLETVLADLRQRNATIEETVCQGRACTIRAGVRLAAVLGYQKDLAAMTGGSARAEMRLSHYEVTSPRRLERKKAS